MIYFCATSVFHLLMIIYLLEIEYKDSTQDKTLILLDHVTNLIRCYPKIKNSGLWNDVICVHTDEETTENIAKQLDQIEFQKGDKLHIFGKEFVSFYLLNKAEKKATCILTDEGVMADVNIKNRIKIDYLEEWFQGRTFDFSCLDELWLIDARVSENDEKIKIKDLKMQEVLKQKDIRERYVSKLELVFPRKDCVAKIPQVCFFDVYYLQIYHCISEEFEQYLLEQLVDKMSGYDFAIKTHPDEPNYEKYRNVKQKVYKDSYIPWEVLRFYETECPHKKRIIISYSATGAIYHDKLLFDDGTQIIFLNRIYEKFCTNPIDTYNILPQFTKIYGEENVYFPESFTELEEIVSLILKKEPQSFELNAFEKEQHEYLEYFTEYYKKNWELKPSLNNYTTLLTLEDGHYKTIAEQKIYTVDGKFKFIFQVTINTKKHIKWYIARSRKVSLRIGQISCINDSEVLNVDINALIYDQGEDRPDGYKDMVILEPSVEFDLPCEKADKIIITGEWQFDFSYDGLIEILRKKCVAL